MEIDLILTPRGNPRNPGAENLPRDLINIESLRQRVKPEKFDTAKRQLLNPTRAEEAFAYRLGRSRLKGWPFLRQEVVLGYILDFYFPSVGICVEIDGEYHNTPEQIELDNQRDAALLRSGITTIRITNDMAINQTGRAVAYVRNIIFAKAQRIIKEKRHEKQNPL